MWTPFISDAHVKLLAVCMLVGCSAPEASAPVDWTSPTSWKRLGEELESIVSKRGSRLEPPALFQRSPMYRQLVQEASDEEILVGVRESGPAIVRLAGFMAAKERASESATAIAVVAFGRSGEDSVLFYEPILRHLTTLPATEDVARQIQIAIRYLSNDPSKTTALVAFISGDVLNKWFHKYVEHDVRSSFVQSAISKLYEDNAKMKRAPSALLQQKLEECGTLDDGPLALYLTFAPTSDPLFTERLAKLLTSPATTQNDLIVMVSNHRELVRRVMKGNEDAFSTERRSTLVRLIDRSD